MLMSKTITALHYQKKNKERVNVFLEPLFGGVLRAAQGDGPDDPSACDAVNRVGRGELGGFFLAEDGADLDGDGASWDDEDDCVFLDTENVITGSRGDNDEPVLKPAPVYETFVNEPEPAHKPESEMQTEYPNANSTPETPV